MSHLPKKRIACLKVVALVVLIGVGHFLKTHPMDDYAMAEMPAPLTSQG